MNLADCRTLLGHAEWADALVWTSVLASGEEDADLHARLHHLHMVQWSYLHVWEGEQVTPREIGMFPTLATIRGWARQYYRKLPSWLGTVTGADLAGAVVFPWAERVVERFGAAEPTTLAESVLQVAMHSTYHRGQVARRLREIGVEPPLTDFIVWIWLGRPGADWGSEEAA